MSNTYDTMRVQGVNGETYEVFGHGPDSDLFSVWGGPMFDAPVEEGGPFPSEMLFSGRADHPGAEAQAAGALAEMSARGMV